MFCAFLSYKFSPVVKDIRFYYCVLGNIKMSHKYWKMKMCLFSWISHYRIIFRTGKQRLQLFLLAEVQFPIHNPYSSPFMRYYVSPDQAGPYFRPDPYVRPNSYDLLCGQSKDRQSIYQIWSRYLHPLRRYARRYRISKMGRFGVVRSHWRSLEIAQFDAVHKTAYAFLLAFHSSYALSCSIFEI